MGYGIGIRGEAAPTMSMKACLRRLALESGKLVQYANHYKVVSARSSTLYWFPTKTGNGLISRGMVDADGYLTDLGRNAIE